MLHSRISLRTGSEARLKLRAHAQLEQQPRGVRAQLHARADVAERRGLLQYDDLVPVA